MNKVHRRPRPPILRICKPGWKNCHQRLRQKLPPGEVGFSLCQPKGGGNLTHGPVATGTPNAVSIPVVCPQGTKFTGLAHTHPSGSVLPSQTDIDAARQVGAKLICITNDTQTQCQKV